MFRLVAAMLVLLIGSTAASAQCISRPDGAETRYVENGTALALCLQAELARATAADAARAELDAALGNLQIEIDRQRRLQDQLLNGLSF